MTKYEKEAFQTYAVLKFMSGSMFWMYHMLKTIQVIGHYQNANQKHSNISSKPNG